MGRGMFEERKMEENAKKGVRRKGREGEDGKGKRKRERGKIKKPMQEGRVRGKKEEAGEKV